MINNLFERQFRYLFSLAYITVNGPEPWDIRVLNKDTYRRSILGGHKGFGESYMDGWWNCPDLEEMFYRLLSADIDKKIISPTIVSLKLFGALFNMQKPSRVYDVANTHYNLGNGLFKRMLDDRMIYSCGYWKYSDNLEDAQEDKLRLVFDKINLSRHENVLDIGCGWGGAAEYAANNYGASVTGITISEEQAKMAKDRCRDSEVNISVMDYRLLNDKFDKIYSIGMFEHVGHKNYREYFKTVNRCLKDDGLFLLHTIGTNTPSTTGDPWVNKYIFPNGMLPSASQITKSYEGLFVLEDWHCFSYDYSLTLKEWYINFEEYWSEMFFKYDDRFYLMWKYYLLSFSAAFRSRSIQLWQIVLSKNGIRGHNYVTRDIKQH
jgi:cyclopropane-fatty-acyl-phospholipid synthase